MTLTPESAALLLPEGTRLVHIGPPKTGTTTLQSAFHAARTAIAAEGVRYAGNARQPVKPVLAVTERPAPLSGVPPPITTWQRLVREVDRAREPRAVISSEFFADAQPEAIQTIVRDLGGERVHIAITLRPLARILPSQWQQYVQSGMRASYDTWLDEMFNKPNTKLVPTFWQRHRHDRLVARWAEVVGSPNVTVVVLDEGDHAMVLRTFESLLGLSTGILVADEDLENRSMTLAEAEVVRAFNIAFREEGLGTPLHTKIMRYGAALYMKTRAPAPEEPRIQTPSWALERVALIAREMVDNIVASGVRLVGDPEELTRPPSGGLPGSQPRLEISPEVAASAAVGVLLASGLARGARAVLPLPADAPEDVVHDLDPYVPPTRVEPPDLFRISTRQLATVVGRRFRAEIGARRHGLRRLFGPTNGGS